MKEIVEWLVGVEDRALKIYKKAAKYFSGDKDIAALLTHLAMDEEVHYNFLCKAVELAQNAPPFIVYLTNDIKQKVEDNFALCEKRLEKNRLSKEDLIDCIVSNEYSEWNNLSLYVINTLKHHHREFIPVVANLYQHKRHIERFLEQRPEFTKFLERVRLLPSVWREKLLVVDDDVMIVDLLLSILSDEGGVESAGNGKEGLRKMGEKYYAAIITDVDMPVMNGIEFYKRAVEIFPNIHKRFLFFTGSDGKVISFFKENNLRYLTKPSTIGDVKKAVIETLSG